MVLRMYRLQILAQAEAGRLLRLLQLRHGQMSAGSGGSPLLLGSVSGARPRAGSQSGRELKMELSEFAENKTILLARLYGKK